MAEVDGFRASSESKVDKLAEGFNVGMRKMESRMTDCEVLGSQQLSK